jgi:outer membrane protein
VNLWLVFYNTREKGGREEMRKFSVCMSIVLISVMGGLAFGETGYKLAFVDLQKALNLCKAGQDAKEEFAKQVEKAEQSLMVKQEELKKIKEILEKQSAMLNEETFKNKEKDFQAKRRDFKRLYEESQDELKVQDNEAVKEILEALVQVVQEYGKEKGFTFILEKSESALLFADEALEVTEDILKLYDQQYLEKGKSTAK